MSALKRLISAFALVPLLWGCAKPEADPAKEFGPDAPRPKQIQSMREKQQQKAGADKTNDAEKKAP
jgi:hypothetical protein